MYFKIAVGVIGSTDSRQTELESLAAGLSAGSLARKILVSNFSVTRAPFFQSQDQCAQLLRRQEAAVNPLQYHSKHAS